MILSILIIILQANTQCVLNILNDSEFLKSVGKVCQIFGVLCTIESLPYFTVDLQLVINDLELLKEYGQSFFLNISLTIGGDKQFIKFIDFCHENMYIFYIFKKFAETRITVIVNYS